jgi:hypothetical protein
MTAKLSTSAQLESRRRRRRLLLFLLLSLIALTWIFPATSAGVSEGFKSEPTQAPPSATPSATPVPSLLETPGSTGVGDGSGSAGMGDVRFTISGGGAANLELGVPTVISLRLTNPNRVPIYVTTLTVAVSKGTDPAGCPSADNLHLTQSNVSGADPITIAAGSGITLTSAPRAPQVTLINRPDVNQDACKLKVFHLAYSGSAHS